MLTMKDIIRDGHPTLRQKTAELELPLTEEEKETLIAMREFLVDSQDGEIVKRYDSCLGVGLTTPQIDISKRMIAVLIPGDGNGKSYDYVLMDPKVVSHSIQEAYLPTDEGCLSADDDVAGLVHHHSRITIKAKDIEGNNTQLRLKGYPAVVSRHEIDHLNGIMFYDHIDKSHPLQPHTGAIEV